MKKLIKFVHIIKLDFPMVKLTKFQIETKLGLFIANNDYEQLVQFISTQSDADVNGYLIRKRGGLLNVAIQNKSKECFNLIITHPNFTAISTKPEFKFGYWDDSSYDIYEEYVNPGPFQDVNNVPNQQNQILPQPVMELADEEEESPNMTPDRYSYIIGTGEAIKIYVRAPNLANVYYLIKLVYAKAFFSPENLTALEKFPEIYNQICAYTVFTQDYLLGILREQICSKSQMAPNTFLKVNLNLELVSWFAKLTVRQSHMNFLRYLFEVYGSGIKLFEYGKSTDILTYSFTLYDRKEMFKVMEAIIAQYIKDPIGDTFDAYMFVQHFIECEYDLEMAKMQAQWSQLKLPVDLGPYVRSFLKYVYHRYWEQYHTELSYCRSKFSNLCLILKSPWCKTNPWDFTDNEKIKAEIKKKLAINQGYSATSNAHMLRKTFKNFAHVFIANGFEPTSNAKQAMEILGINYEELVASTPKWIKANLKDLFQDKLEQSSTKPVKVVKKPRGKKVQSQIVLDVDVELDV
jgi:hypothetical protein